MSGLAPGMQLRRSRNLALGLVLVLHLSPGCGPREAPAPTGQIMYLRHCASCHGESGKGDGSVAASLRTQPSDLTTIAERAGGRFDDARVMRVIDGRRAVAEHGTRDMPVWGVVFAEELAGERNAAYVVLLQARSLTDYVRSMQAE